MKSNTYQCLDCKGENVNGSTHCLTCGKTTIFASLKSLGRGSSPKGFVWPLYPFDASLGAGPSNDIVIPSDQIPLSVCDLIYDNKRYYIKIHYPGKVTVRGHTVHPDEPKRLEHGDIIKVGLDQMVIHYRELAPHQKVLQTQKEIGEDKLEQKNAINPIAARLMLTLGYLQELHSSLSLHELMDSFLDTVLKVTHLDRAYAFSVDYNVDGELDLQEMGSRKLGHEDIDEVSYTISQSMLTQVIESNGAVLIEDADHEKVPLGHSVQDFKIKTAVCVPLMQFDHQTGKNTIFGVVYADKLLAKTKLPSHCRSTLQLLAQMTVGNINRITRFEKAIEVSNSYETYLKGIVEGMETIESNLVAIKKGCHQSTNTKDLEMYLELFQNQIETLASFTKSAKELID